MAQSEAFKAWKEAQSRVSLIRSQRERAESKLKKLCDAEAAALAHEKGLRVTWVMLPLADTLNALCPQQLEELSSFSTVRMPFCGEYRGSHVRNDDLETLKVLLENKEYSKALEMFKSMSE